MEHKFEHLKQNRKVFSELTKKEQAFFNGLPQAEVFVLGWVGEIHTLALSHHPRYSGNVYRWTPPKKLYDRLFIPTVGVDLLDPERTKVGETVKGRNCSCDSLLGNARVLKRCKNQACSDCICNSRNADALRQWQADNGGMKQSPRVPPEGYTLLTDEERKYKRKEDFDGDILYWDSIRSSWLPPTHKKGDFDINALYVLKGKWKEPAWNPNMQEKYFSPDLLAATYTPNICGMSAIKHRVVSLNEVEEQNNES